MNEDIVEEEQAGNVGGTGVSAPKLAGTAYSSLEEMRKDEADALKERLALSDRLEKMTRFIADETEGDEEYRAIHDEAVKSNDFLANNKTAFAGMDDADMAFLAEDIMKKYDEASKRRGHLDVAWDALKRGHSSLMNMLVQGWEAWKPGEASQDDIDIIRGAQRNAKDDEVLAPQKIGGVENISSIVDAVDCLLETVGENLARMAFGAAAATAGAVAAPIVGVSAGVGAGILGGASGLLANTGEGVEDNTDDKMEDGDIRNSLAWARAQGTGYSILEGAFGVTKYAGRIWGSLLRRAGLKEAAKTAEVAALKDIATKASLKGVAKEVGKAVLSEGAEEVMQSQGVGRGVRYFRTGSIFRKKDDGTYETPGDAFLEAVNEFAGGATASLTFGLLGGASSHADARRAVKINNDIMSALKDEKTYKMLDPYGQLLVTRKMINDAYLATTELIKPEVRASYEQSNRDINAEIRELSRSDNPSEKLVGQSAQAYLDIFNSQYSLQELDEIFGVDSATGEFLSRDGGKYRSNVDPSEMLNNGSLIVDKNTGNEVVVYRNRTPGSEVSVGEMLDEDGKPTGKYMVQNDRHFKTPLGGEGDYIYDSRDKAFEAARRLDAYNQWREDRLASKAAVANKVFRKLFGSRGVNLKFVDRPTEGNHSIGTTIAVFVPNPKDGSGPRVELDIEKINNLGTLYTTLVHERSHEDIVEFLLKSGKFYRKVGDRVVPDWNALEAARLELMSKVQDEKGVTAEETSKKFRGEGGEATSEWGKSAGVAGEEMIAERNSVFELAKQVRNMNRGLVGSMVDKVRQAIGLRMAYEMGVDPSAITPDDVAEEMDEIFDLGYVGEAAPSEFKRETPKWQGQSVDKNATKGGQIRKTVGQQVAQTANGEGEVNLGTVSDEETPAAKPRNLKPQMKAGGGNGYSDNANIRRADGVTFTKVGTSDGSYAWKNLDTNELVGDEVASEGGYEEIYDEKPAPKQTETKKPASESEKPVETAETAQSKTTAKPPKATSSETGENGSVSAPKEMATTSSPEAAKPVEGGNSASSATKAPKTVKKVAKQAEKKPVKASKPAPKPTPKAEEPQPTQKPAEGKDVNLRDLIGQAKSAIDLIVKGDAKGNDLYLAVENAAKSHFAAASDSALAGEIEVLRKNDENSASGPHHALLGVAYDEQNRREKAKKAKAVSKTETPTPTAEKKSEVAAPTQSDEKAPQSAPKEMATTSRPEAAKPVEKQEARPAAKEEQEPARVNTNEDTLTVEQGKENGEAQSVNSEDEVTLGTESDNEETRRINNAIDETVDNIATFVNDAQRKAVKERARELGEPSNYEKAKKDGYVFVEFGDLVNLVGPDGRWLTAEEAEEALAQGDGEDNPVLRAKTVIPVLLPKISAMTSTEITNLLDRDAVREIRMAGQLSDDRILKMAMQDGNMLALRALWSRWTRKTKEHPDGRVQEWFMDKGVSGGDVGKWVGTTMKALRRLVRESDFLEMWRESAEKSKDVMDGIKRDLEKNGVRYDKNEIANPQKGTPLGRTVGADAFLYGALNFIWADATRARAKEEAERLMAERSEQVRKVLEEEKEAWRRQKESDRIGAQRDGVSVEEFRRRRVAAKTVKVAPEYEEFVNAASDEKMTDEEFANERRVLGRCVSRDGRPFDEDARRAVLVKASEIVGRMAGSKLGAYKGMNSSLNVADVNGYVYDLIERQWRKGRSERSALWNGESESKGNNLKAYVMKAIGIRAMQLWKDSTRVASLDERLPGNEYGSDDGVADSTRESTVSSTATEAGLSNEERRKEEEYRVQRGWFATAEDAVDGIVGSGVLPKMQSDVLLALVNTWKAREAEAEQDLESAKRWGKSQRTISSLERALKAARKASVTEAVVADAAESANMREAVYRGNLLGVFAEIEKAMAGEEIHMLRKYGAYMTPEQQKRSADLSKGMFSAEAVELLLSGIFENAKNALGYDVGNLVFAMRANGDALMAKVVEMAAAGKTNKEIFDEYYKKGGSLGKLRNRYSKNAESAPQSLEAAYERYGWIDTRVFGPHNVREDRVKMFQNVLRSFAGNARFEEGKRKDYVKAASVIAEWLEAVGVDVNKAYGAVSAKELAKDDYRTVSAAIADNDGNMSGARYDVKKANPLRYEDMMRNYEARRNLDDDVVKAIDRNIRDDSKAERDRQKRIANKADHARVQQMMADNGGNEAAVREALKREGNDDRRVESMFTHWRAGERDLAERERRLAEREAKREAGFIEGLSEEKKAEVDAALESVAGNVSRALEILGDNGWDEKQLRQARNHYDYVKQSAERESEEALERMTFAERREKVMELLSREGDGYMSDDEVIAEAVGRYRLPKAAARMIVDGARVKAKVATDADLSERSARIERETGTRIAVGSETLRNDPVSSALDREAISEAKDALAKAEKKLDGLGKGALRDYKRVQERLDAGMSEVEAKADLRREGLSDKYVEKAVEKHRAVVEARAKVDSAKETLAKAEERLEKSREKGETGLRAKTVVATFDVNYGASNEDVTVSATSVKSLIHRAISKACRGQWFRYDNVQITPKSINGKPVSRFGIITADDNRNPKRSAALSKAFGFERSGEVPEADMAVHGNTEAGRGAAGVAGGDRRDGLAENRGQNVRDNGSRQAVGEKRWYSLTGVEPSPDELDSEGLSELRSGSVRYKTSGLYTGSAADYNKPSLLKIGTGEGTQVYGWGLYASNRIGVAESYAKKGDRKNEFSIDGKPTRFNYRDKYKIPAHEFGVKQIVDFLVSEDGRVEKEKTISKNDIINEIKNLGHLFDLISQKDVDAAIEYVNRHEFTVRPANSYVYEQSFFTNRAPGDESHLLSWYEPVSKENIDRINAQLKNEGRSYRFEDALPSFEGWVSDVFGDIDDANKTAKRWGLSNAKELYDLEAKNHSTGAVAYDELVKEFNSDPKAASEFLVRADIDGIKYPVDSYGGKTVKDGDKVGWNYVSFRDDNISMDHKWVDGTQRFKTTAGHPTTGLSDPNVIFAANESQATHGWGFVGPKRRKPSSVTLSEAKGIVATDPLLHVPLRKLKEGTPLTDAEQVAITIRIEQLDNDLRNGSLIGEEFDNAEKMIRDFSVALDAAGTLASHSLNSRKYGVNLRVLDSDVYIQEQTKAKFKKEIEDRFGVGSVGEHEARILKELGEKSGRIKEMSSQLSLLHEKLDEAEKKLAEKDEKAENEAIERAYLRGMKQGEKQATEAERKRRLEEISNAVEKFGAIKERSGVGVDAANAVFDIFGAARRFAGNPKSGLTDQMRNAFAGVIYMFDGDAEKARKYLSAKSGDAGVFKEKIEPMFNAYLAEEEKAAKPKDGTVKEKKRIVKERIRRRAESSAPSNEPSKTYEDRLKRKAVDAYTRALMADSEDDAMPHIGEFARVWFKILAYRKPGRTVDEYVSGLAAKMNELYGKFSKGADNSRFDVQDARDALFGRNGFEPVTRERAKVELARILKAQKLLSEGKEEEARKEAGLRGESDADVLQELDGRIGAILNTKLNRLEERIEDRDEDTSELRKEIHDLIMALHDIRSGKPVSELLGKYLDLAVGMKDYRKRRTLLDQLESRKAMYERKLKENDFETVPKVSPPDNEEELLKVADAKRHLEKVRERFKKERSAWRVGKGPVLSRIVGSIFELLGEVKAVAGSWDLSAVLRQGGQMTLAHPIMAYRSFRKTLEALKSEERANEIMDEIAHRPNYRYYLEAGIDFTDWGDNAASAEDLYILNKYRLITRNKLMKWGISTSERAFVTYLNLMRANVFDAMVAASPMREAKNCTKPQLKAFGDFVNVASQRGMVDQSGKLGKALEAGNAIFWSPRNLLSRFQFIWNTAMLAVPGSSYYGISGDRAMRLAFAKETGRYLAGVAAMVFFAKMMADLLRDDDEPPVDIVTDPRSSDFMKVKVGNTRLDFLSGLQQVLVFGSRMWTGEATQGSGNTVKKDRGSIAFRFMRTKFSPMAGFVYDLYTGEDFDRRSISWNPAEQLKRDKDVIGVSRYTAGSIFAPLIFSDVIEQAEDSIGRLPATLILTGLGAGVQTYDSATYKLMKQDYQYFKRLWKAADTEEERDRLVLYHPMLKRMGTVDEWISSVNALERNLKKLEEAGAKPSGLKTMKDEIERRKKVVLGLLTGAKNPTQVE